MQHKRKHRTQFTPAELVAVTDFIHNNKWVDQSPHSNEMGIARSIPDKDIEFALMTGHVIEVSRKRNSTRALVRAPFNDRQDICVVVAFKDLTIVTSWLIAADDHHDSMDLSDYNWNVNLVKTMEMFVGFQALDKRTTGMVA